MTPFSGYIINNLEVYITDLFLRHSYFFVVILSMAMNAGMSICWVTKEMDGERGDDNIIRVAHVSDLADMFEEAFAEQI